MRSLRITDEYGEDFPDHDDDETADMDDQHSDHAAIPSQEQRPLGAMEAVLDAVPDIAREQWLASMAADGGVGAAGDGASAGVAARWYAHPCLISPEAPRLLCDWTLRSFSLPAFIVSVRACEVRRSQLSVLSTCSIVLSCATIPLTSAIDAPNLASLLCRCKQCNCTGMNWPVAGLGWSAARPRTPTPSSAPRTTRGPAATRCSTRGTMRAGLPTSTARWVLIVSQCVCVCLYMCMWNVVCPVPLPLWLRQRFANGKNATENYQAPHIACRCRVRARIFGPAQSGDGQVGSGVPVFVEQLSMPDGRLFARERALTPAEVEHAARVQQRGYFNEIHDLFEESEKEREAAAQVRRIYPRCP
eukprot:COSAG05_NODE_959_length_6425_cov_4.388397_6_plen_360_part_00